jgi:hypothetical protein
MQANAYMHAFQTRRGKQRSEEGSEAERKLGRSLIIIHTHIRVHKQCNLHIKDPASEQEIGQRELQYSHIYLKGS